MPDSYDVIVVGGGNAGFCAALAARESGASVLVLEAAPEAERGGNSRFTAGAMRVTYNGVNDLARLMPDLTEEEKANTDFGVYPEDQFYDDLCRVTQYRTTPRLAETLVTRSFDTMLWMRSRGSASRQFTDGRLSRLKDASSSGAASRSRPGAAAPD